MGNNWTILVAWPSRSRCCSRCGRSVQPYVLIMEAEVLNAYCAVYREISFYRAPWQARGYEREIARLCAVWRNCADYREIPRRKRASRAISCTFPHGNVKQHGTHVHVCT